MQTISEVKEEYGAFRRQAVHVADVTAMPRADKPYGRHEGG